MNAWQLTTVCECWCEWVNMVKCLSDRNAPFINSYFLGAQKREQSSSQRTSGTVWGGFSPEPRFKSAVRRNVCRLSAAVFSPDECRLYNLDNHNSQIGVMIGLKHFSVFPAVIYFRLIVLSLTCMSRPRVSNQLRHVK